MESVIIISNIQLNSARSSTNYKSINSQNEIQQNFIRSKSALKEIDGSILSNFNNKKYSNLFVNPYDFTEHYEIRGLELPDDELVSYLKEISFEMNLISKSKEIYRLGVSWFSNFLFHSCTFNQTNLSNKDRYFPPYN